MRYLVVLPFHAYLKRNSDIKSLYAMVSKWEKLTLYALMFNQEANELAPMHQEILLLILSLLGIFLKWNTSWVFSKVPFGV